MTKKKCSKQLKSYLVCSCLANEVFKSDLVNIPSHHSCQRQKDVESHERIQATPLLSSALAQMMPSDAECSSPTVGNSLFSSS